VRRHARWRHHVRRWRHPGRDRVLATSAAATLHGRLVEVFVDPKLYGQHRTQVCERIPLCHRIAVYALHTCRECRALLLAVVLPQGVYASGCVALRPPQTSFQLKPKPKPKYTGWLAHIVGELPRCAQQCDSVTTPDWSGLMCWLL
jgi:hypothetical protein